MTSPGRVLGRRRRANVDGGRAGRPLKVRLSEEERAVLAGRCAEAGGITLQRLLVEAALSDAGGTPSERRRALVELFDLRRQLVGVATNVNQLAHRANVGEGFPVLEARDLLAVAKVLALRIDGVIDGLAGEGVVS